MCLSSLQCQFLQSQSYLDCDYFMKPVHTLWTIKDLRFVCSSFLVCERCTEMALGLSHLSNILQPHQPRYASKKIKRRGQLHPHLLTPSLQLIMKHLNPSRCLETVKSWFDLIMSSIMEVNSWYICQVTNCINLITVCVPYLHLGLERPQLHVTERCNIKISKNLTMLFFSV